MKGKSADLEMRERAFRLYRECGGNKEMTVKRLADAGYRISKPTLYDWIGKYNFDERMARADEKTLEARDAAHTTETRLMADLLRQKEKYEKYFDGLGAGIDNQAQYAYTSLVKTIVDIKARLGADKAALFTEFIKDLIGYLSKEDLEAMGALEPHADGFAAFAREKYGA